MLDALCPACGKTWRVPVAGKKYPCRVCGADVVAAQAADAPGPPPAPLAPAGAEPDAAPPDAVVAPVDAGAPPPRPLPRRSVISEFREKYAARDRQDRIRAVPKWLFWLGVILIVAGGFVSYVAKKEADKALLALSTYEPDEKIEIPGRGEVSVEVLRKEVKFEAFRIWILNGVLAAAFIGLSFWARSSPLPAAVTGLCLYLVIQLLNAIADPTTLVKGLVIKILFIAAMAKAISSAVTERRLLEAAARKREAAEPAPAP